MARLLLKRKELIDNLIVFAICSVVYAVLKYYAFGEPDELNLTYGGTFFVERNQPWSPAWPLLDSLTGLIAKISNQDISQGITTLGAAVSGLTGCMCRQIASDKFSRLQSGLLGIIAGVWIAAPAGGWVGDSFSYFIGVCPLLSRMAFKGQIRKYTFWALSGIILPLGLLSKWNAFVPAWLISTTPAMMIDVWRSRGQLQKPFKYISLFFVFALLSTVAGAYLCNIRTIGYLDQIRFYHDIVEMRSQVSVGEKIGFLDAISFRIDISKAISKIEPGNIAMIPILAMFWSSFALAFCQLSGWRGKQRDENRRLLKFLIVLLTATWAAGITANRGINHRIYLIPYASIFIFMLAENDRLKRLSNILITYSYSVFLMLAGWFIASNPTRAREISMPLNRWEIQGDQGDRATIIAHHIQGAGLRRKIPLTDIALTRGRSTQIIKAVSLGGLANGAAEYGTLPIGAKLRLDYLNQMPGEQHINEKWNPKMHNEYGIAMLSSYYAKNLKDSKVAYVVESILPPRALWVTLPKTWLKNRVKLRDQILRANGWTLIFKGKDANIWKR